jgi:hypothetical protein
VREMEFWYQGYNNPPDFRNPAACFSVCFGIFCRRPDRASQARRHARAL